MPDDQPVSSPATVTPAEVAAPPVAEAPGFPGIFDEETPAPAEKQEESAPSETTSEPEAKEPEGESASASEAANRSDTEINEKPETKAERRIKQLTAQVKTYERQLAEVTAPKPTATSQAPAPVRPDINKFDTVEEFNAALEKYEGDVRRYAIEQDRQARSVAEQAEAQKRTEAEALKTFEKRMERVEKEVPGFKAELPKMLTVIQPNPTTDGFLLDSEVGPEVLRYLYDNPDEAERIRELKPYATIRELVKLENQLSDQIKGIKAKPAPVPPKKVAARESTPVSPKSAADILYG